MQHTVLGSVAASDGSSYDEAFSHVVDKLGELQITLSMALEAYGLAIRGTGSDRLNALLDELDRPVWAKTRKRRQHRPFMDPLEGREIHREMLRRRARLQREVERMEEQELNKEERAKLRDMRRELKGLQDID